MVKSLSIKCFHLLMLLQQFVNDIHKQQSFYGGPVARLDQQCYLFFFLAIKRNISIHMVHLAGNCQKEKANRNILSYTLKESYHMYGFSKRALSVEARRLSSRARVFIDLDSDQEKTLYHYCFPFFLPATESLCSQTRSVCQFIKREAVSGVTGLCSVIINILLIQVFAVVKMHYSISHWIPDI